MVSFFSYDNPVWKFIGNLADFFLLSLVWLICSLPIVTMGAASTALYYVTLKMAENKEGRLLPAFFASFRQNLKQGSLIWLGFLLAGSLIGFDLLWASQQGTLIATAMFVTFAIIGVIYACCLSFVFVVLARCDNTVSAIFKMSCGMVIRNFPAVLAGVVVYAGFFLVGAFLFWPLLLVAPALPAYLNSFLYNRILAKYDLSLT